uniref:RNA binding motif protein 42 n=1 Tax=Monodelphis domestica TaxID=13616 RepID=A0A5F8H5D4_MONDO
MAGTGPPPGLPGAAGAVPSGPGPGVPGKSGEERLKEMEAEMALFEQEVLGAPISGIPTPVVPAGAPVIRPIIATNTYQQVQQSLEARAAAAATVIAPIVGPPGPFVGPVGFGPGGDRGRLDSPEARDAMFLRRAAGGPRPMALRPPHQALVGPPLPGPPGPPMMLPPMARAPGPPLGTMATLRPPPEEPPAPRELGLGLGLGLKEKEEAAAVAVAAAAAAGLEEAGAAVGGPGAAAVIGPSLPLPLAMPLPEPEPLPLPLEVVRGLLPPLRIPELLSLRPRPRPRPEPQPPPGLMALEVPEPLGEDKKKGKPEKLKRCIRTAAGSSWEDPSLLEWDAGKYVGSRPIKLRKSMWKDRNLDVVRKKQKEKKKLGLR